MDPTLSTAAGVERERQRGLAELAAEHGADWEHDFRPRTLGSHELLDRTSLLVDLLDRHLLSHPSCLADAEWYALAERAAGALRELYQRVGAAQLQ